MFHVKHCVCQTEKRRWKKRVISAGDVKNNVDCGSGSPLGWHPLLHTESAVIGGNRMFHVKHCCQQTVETSGRG